MMGIVRTCRMLITFVSVLSCVVLSGCWDRIEINDMAIVMATGVDYENDKVHLTAQIFVPRKAGGGDSTGGSGSPSGVTLIRTAEGQNIAEALNRLQRKVPRNMFWGHCEVIVINEDAGKHGLREYIDFFCDTRRSGSMLMFFPRQSLPKEYWPCLIRWKEVLLKLCVRWLI